METGAGFRRLFFYGAGQSQVRRRRRERRRLTLRRTIKQMPDANSANTTHIAMVNAGPGVMKGNGVQPLDIDCIITAMIRLEIVTGRNSTNRRLINSSPRNNIAITIQNTGVINQRVSARDNGFCVSPVMLD